MATCTTNRYGKITVTERAILQIANLAISECYGVASGDVMNIVTLDNTVNLSIDICLKYGVTPLAVSEAVRKQVKHSIENFCDMPVRAMNINVIGIK